MKVAVFGGTGFLGSNFVRFASRHGGVEPVVYTTGGESPSGLSAREVELRRYPADDPETISFDDDVDAVVNFALQNPEQIERFARLIASARRQQHALRLIHLSSMSVYEPFRPDYYFAESDPLDPPPDQGYAREKVLAEAALQALADADQWQLHLRPTVVYGPFCRPWTDRIFEAFRRGDVDYWDLSGRIQPVWGEDVSRFVYERLLDFRPGIYNVAGPEEMPWRTFVETFRDIVGTGRLVRAPGVARSSSGVVQRALRKVARIAGRDAPAHLFTHPDFAEDGLVSREQWRRDFPTFRLSRLSEAKDALAEYYRARFAD